MSKKHSKNTQAKALQKAVVAYRKSELLFKEFTELFPFAMEGEMPEDKRKKGAGILRKIEEPDREGLQQLKKVVEVWE